MPVFIATTVILSFISFWRAAAIVLSDLASSAFYADGNAEKVIGKTAPWFILAVMLFSYAVRAVYSEASSMFVRGVVYRVVRQAMGDTLAKRRNTLPATCMTSTSNRYEEFRSRTIWSFPLHLLPHSKSWILFHNSKPQRSWERSCPSCRREDRSRP